MILLAIPGDLDTPTGGYAYARRLVTELQRMGRPVSVVALGDGFPHAAETVRAAAVARIADLSRAAPVIVDGLALGVLPELAAVAAGRYIALVHHPLALETGLDAMDTERLRASEAAALAGAAHVITTSAATACLLASDYRVPMHRLSVARPGTDAAPVGRGSCGTPSLLSVGSLVRRKGHDVLLEAFARLGDLPAHLTIAGDAGRDRACAAALTAQLTALGLRHRVTLAGAVDAAVLDRLYDGADLFVLASRHEGYGMAYAEAIARGLPVIGTNVGAIPEAVGEAGLLVPADDPAALAVALRRLLEDHAARAALAGKARAAALRLPRWTDAAEVVAGVIDSVQVALP